MTSKNANAPQPCRRHHGELLTVFSKKFDKCMCLKCAMEQHDLLSDFMPISEGVELMKSTGQSLVNEINTLTDITKVIKRDRMKYIENIHASEKNIKANVRKIRDKINRHLDLLEHKLFTQLKKIIDNNELAFHKDQHDIQLIETELKKVKQNVDTKLKSASDVEMITGIAVEKANVQSKKLDIRAHQSRMPTKSLQFRLSQPVLELTERVKAIGEVSMQKPFDEFDDEEQELDFSPVPASFRSSVVPVTHPVPLPISTPLSFTAHDVYAGQGLSKYSSTRVKNKYGIHVSNPYHSVNAQFNTSRNLPNGNVSYRTEHGDEATDPYNDFEGVRDDPIVLSAEHSGPCNLTGIAALSSGRIVVCDSKHKCIQLINRRSEVLDELVFHYKPCDIASISDDGVVVSFVEKDFISVYSVSTRALSHKRDVSISGRGGSYSIAFCKDKFAVCRRGEIKLVSSYDGKLIDTIQIEAHFPQIAMSDGGSKIYLSDFVGGRVTCMNEQGRTKWEYSQENLEPCSLAVDLNQLFIADVKGAIFIMSTYGILMRQLQCQGHLHAICVDANTGTLLVTQENNRDKGKSRSIKIIAI
ncbi:hypothetical protein DPMN_057769 [Dreissena polymorpha]|uniref:Uncharacterized protein n=1 Tax=Dreissena polymorpha TaxID=45954 RepID=A0A9D4C0R0_DREPO|nr:hypothetical protein DPMN_057769 [Dreissena polymorpha]